MKILLILFVKIQHLLKIGKINSDFIYVRMRPLVGWFSMGPVLRYWEKVFLGHPSSDSVTIKMPYRVDVSLHQPALHPIFSCWVG